MGIESTQEAKIKEWHVKFTKVFKKNYSLSQELNDDIFGQCSLHRNINTGVVEVLEKVLTFSGDS
jgi:hypothetical protein